MDPLSLERLVFDLNWRNERWQPHFKDHLNPDLSLEEGLHVLLYDFSLGCLVTNVALDEHLRLKIRPRGPIPQLNTEGLVPQFVTYLRDHRLVIASVQWRPSFEPKMGEILLKARIFESDAGERMLAEEMRRLIALPSRRGLQDQRIAEWRAFVDWQRGLLEQTRISVAYQQILAPSPWTLCFQIKDSSQVKRVERWEVVRENNKYHERLKKARFVKTLDAGGPGPWLIFDRTPSWADHVSDVAPKGETKAEEARRTQANRDYEAAQKKQAALLSSLPSSGQLLQDQAGDQAVLKSQAEALNLIAQDECHHPGLAEALLGEPEGMTPPNSVRVAEVHAALEGQRLTEDQRRAVALGVAGGPITLLQGPPGTGKTTAITAMVRQIVAQGGRALVTSQTNLAVDNVLERLGENPAIRPARIASEGTELSPQIEALRLKNVVEDHWIPKVKAATTEALRCGAAEIKALRDEADRAQLIEVLGAQAEALRGEIRRAIHTRREAEKQIKAVQTEVATRRVQQRTLASATRAAEGFSKGHFEVQPDVLELLDATRRCLPDEGQIEQAHTLRRLGSTENATPALEALMHLCAGRLTPSPELEVLQARRLELMNDFSDEGMAELQRLQRRLGGLIGQDWASATRALVVHADLLGTRPEFKALTTSLKPSKAQLDGVEALRIYAGVEIKRRAALKARVLKAAEADVERLAVACSVLEDELKTSARGQARLEVMATAAREDEAHQRGELKALTARWSCAIRPLELTEPPPPSQEAATALAQPEVDRLRDEARGARLKRWVEIREAYLKRASEPASEPLRERYLRNINVVGATCYTAAKLSRDDTMKRLMPFDVAIVDEVSKATVPEIVQPASTARRLVLVGDPNQLPPLFRHREETFREAIEEGLLRPEDFERFRNLVTTGHFATLFQEAPEAIKARLTTQFRAHPQIMKATNVFYEGRLKAGPGTEGKIHGLRVEDERGGLFLEPHQHLLWVDSASTPEGKPIYEVQSGTSKANPYEARQLVEVLQRLAEALTTQGLDGRLINQEVDRSRAALDLAQHMAPEVTREALTRCIRDGQLILNGRPATGAEQRVAVGTQAQLELKREVAIISLYGAQIRLIKQELMQAQRAHQANFNAIKLRINSVDRFQGAEAPIVLVSLVRAPKSRRLRGDFARDFRRINVALSRACDLLIILGNRSVLKGALVDLPNEGGEARPVRAYGRVMEIVDEFGGRRHAC